MKFKSSSIKTSFIYTLVFIILFVTVGCSTNISLNSKIDKRTDKTDSDDEGLPVVGTYDNLVSILSNINNNGDLKEYSGVARDMDDAIANEAAIAPTADSANSGADFSTTNVQVDGVDEADIIKTDGKHIYQVNNRQIIIAKVFPSEEMKLVNTIKLNDENYYPMEIYLDSKYLVVIGSAVRNVPMPEPMYDNGGGTSLDIGLEPEVAPGRKIDTNLYYNSYNTIRVYIYNIEQPENASLVRDFEMDGSYISSRKVGSQLYLLSNRYSYYYYYAQDRSQETLVPYYRDSASDKDFIPVDYSRIHYFPDAQDSNYLMIAGINLDKMDAQANITAYLGSGQTIYASSENLYVAVSKWEYQEQPTDIDYIEPNSTTAEPAVDIQSQEGIVSVDADIVEINEDIKVEVSTENDEIADVEISNDVVEIMPVLPAPVANISTLFYKFSLNEGNVTYKATGQVPGSLLNQFSMDEHNGFFRVATTTGQMWWGSDSASKNNLYILDSNLKITGSIQNIAPGERIYSVRFMGDKGYMVTFKTVDPLFVMDLKDPNNPKILGELKIPGYSDYLHPYDENHIIGFGMDAIEAEIKDENNNVVGTTAYQMGMKIAMFDVSDMKNPIEKFKINIGDRGTYSDILYNHKALLFSREKNILAFPVTVYEAKEKWMDKEKNIPDYGTFAFQGIYVFSIDMAKGFNLKARISHLTQQEIEKAQNYWYDYEKTVERAIYIEDTLYTISKAYIKAHDMDGYKRKTTLGLPRANYLKDIIEKDYNE